MGVCYHFGSYYIDSIEVLLPSVLFYYTAIRKDAFEPLVVDHYPRTAEECLNLKAFFVLWRLYCHNSLECIIVEDINEGIVCDDYFIIVQFKVHKWKIGLE